MKRIKLLDKVRNIITLYGSVYGSEEVVKFVQNNYRRRQYKSHGYTCNGCGQFLKPNKICTCKMKGADL